MSQLDFLLHLLAFAEGFVIGSAPGYLLARHGKPGHRLFIANTLPQASRVLLRAIVDIACGFLGDVAAGTQRKRELSVRLQSSLLLLLIKFGLVSGRQLVRACLRVLQTLLVHAATMCSCCYAVFTTAQWLLGSSCGYKRFSTGSTVRVQHACVFGRISHSFMIISRAILGAEPCLGLRS